MGYPVAYRKSAARAARMGGYQSPFDGPSVPRPGTGPSLPVPANDNLPTPANDNLARRAERSAARYFGDKVGARIAGKIAARFIPFLGEALLAYDIYELWKSINDASKNRVPMVSGYRLGGTCHYPSFAGVHFCDAWRSPANVPPVCIVGKPSTPLCGNQFSVLASTLQFSSLYYDATATLKYTDYPLASYRRTAAVSPAGVVQFTHAPAHTPDMPPEHLPWPSLDPMSIPIKQFAPVPQPIPYAALPGLRPSPDAPEKEQHNDGYGQSDAALPASEPIVITLPGIGRIELPTDTVNAPVSSLPSPSAAVSVEGSPRHDFRRNRPFEKQRKFIASPGAGNFIVRAFNAATEAGDFVDALYWALPKKDRIASHWVRRADGRWLRVGATLDQRALAVWRRIDDVNIRTAAKNLIANEITDRLYGGLGRLAARAARRVHELTPYSPNRTATVSRRGTGGLLDGPHPIGEAVDWAFDQFWPV